MTDPEPVMMEPKLTPISKSKKAQACFANTLFDLCAPAFATATATFIPVALLHSRWQPRWHFGLQGYGLHASGTRHRYLLAKVPL
jgi:hypothetical protein